MKRKLFVVFIFTLLLSALFFAETALAGTVTVDAGTGSGFIDLSDSSFMDGDIILINTIETVELRNGNYKNLRIICIVANCNLVIRDVLLYPAAAGIDFTQNGVNTITIEGENRIQSTGDYPGIKVANGNEVHINGSGKLIVYGGNMSPGIGNDMESANNSGLIVIDGGEVRAYGGQFAAGIGSAYLRGPGNVEINGGDVYAYGGENAAGIGGGEQGIGNVEINGGTVHAYGGNGGAGIGGGKYGEGDVLITDGTVYGLGGSEAAGIGGGLSSIGYVEITGGTVYGYGGDDGINDSYGGAGIGGGKSGLNGSGLESNGDGHITISGGTVYAEGANGAAGIGGGAEGISVDVTDIYEGGVGYVTINELGGVCDVEAVGGRAGAGIGGGYGAVAEITMSLTTSTITAYGGSEGAGIGSGCMSDTSACYITIIGGEIEATGGRCAAGIGGGFIGGAIISITNSDVTAVGGTGGAGIGAATPWGTKQGNVTITGGDIYAKGGAGYLFEGIDEVDGGAGIGGGYSVVSISGANVEAIGGAGAGFGYDEMIYGGPGIGGTMGYYGGVTIDGSSMVTATGGDSAAGIGSGEGTESHITVKGGEITATGGQYAAGLGSGEGGNCEIYLQSGTVTATGGEGGAGVGGGKSGHSIVYTYSGSVVTATGGEGGAGIGGGSTSVKGLVYILGGTVKATPGKDAAGIGGGNASACIIVIVDGNIETFTVPGSEAGIGSGYQSTDDFYITIAGGTITARGGNETGQSAAGIGGGASGSLGNVTILGGQIYAIGGDDDACDDIGAGQGGTCGTVTIDGPAAVFLYNDRVCESAGTLVLPVPHMYVDYETVSAGTAYGYTNFPAEWDAQTAIGYIPGISVYFDHNWGTPPTVDTLSTYEGADIAEPAADPVRAGYVFNGWHIDFGCTTPFDFATIKATNGLTIYADWVADGTFKGNLTGSLNDDLGVPVEGAYVTLQSRPVTVTTNAAGEFAYGNIYYINHTLIVNDNGGTELKRYAVTFTPGGSPSSSVDEGAGTIAIVYTSAATGVNIPLGVDASGTTVTVSGPITFALAGTDPATGRAINPNTGDDGMGIAVYVMIMAGILIGASAAYVWRKRKLSRQQ